MHTIKILIIKLLNLKLMNIERGTRMNKEKALLKRVKILLECISRDTHQKQIDIIIGEIIEILAEDSRTLKALKREMDYAICASNAAWDAYDDAWYASFGGSISPKVRNDAARYAIELHDIAEAAEEAYNKALGKQK